MRPERLEVLRSFYAMETASFAGRRTFATTPDRIAIALGSSKRTGLAGIRGALIKNIFRRFGSKSIVRNSPLYAIDKVIDILVGLLGSLESGHGAEAA